MIRFQAAILILICLGVSSLFAQPNRGVGVKIRNEAGQTQEVRLYEGSYALVIGASGYNSGWQKLPGVREDVTAVRKILTKHGFTVETSIDPDSQNLLASINNFVNKYGFVENNRLLIYFAGHGYTETGGDGRKFGYIVPIDAPDPKKNQIGFQQKAVTMDEIETVARRIRSKHALFVFDSCFSGSLVSRSKTVVPPIINYLAAQSVRQFITAGADNQEVPDESVFRQMFVRGLEGEADANKDGHITGTELAVYLQEQVIYYRGELQTPQYGKIRDPKLDRGDFVFVVEKASTAVSQPEPPKTPETAPNNSTPNKSSAVVKIGIYSSAAFGDEKNGIKKLVNANNILETEFRPVDNELQAMQAKYADLSKEIQRLRNLVASNAVSRSELQTKADEAETLAQEIKRIQNKAKVAYEKRSKEVLDPVYNEILSFQKTLENQNSIRFFDAATDQSGQLLALDNNVDITNTFIGLYNSHASGQSVPLTMSLPQNKIAFIDTAVFGDEANGINAYSRGVKQLDTEFKALETEIDNLRNKIKAATGPDEKERLERELKFKEEDGKAKYEKRRNQVLGPIMQDIGKKIELFRSQNGYTVIFDSSKNLPAEISSLSGTDATKAFINYYNILTP